MKVDVGISRPSSFLYTLHTMHEMHLEDLGVAFNTSGVLSESRKKNPLVKL